MGDNYLLLGDLGRDTYRTRLNDLVDLEAELSEPAYTYLLAFNPSDKPEDQEHLCPPEAGQTPPEMVDRLKYPVGGKARLTDGVGLQAFVLVASREPLPAYAEWRKGRAAVAWRRTRASSGVVWRGDGHRLERLFAPGDERVTVVRDEEEAMLKDLCQQLRRAPRIEAVAAVAFAVERAD
jgi:hypothetical protein